MKTFIKGMFFLACTFLVSFKSPSKISNFENSTKFDKNEKEEEFVELMDGKIIKGNVTKCNVFKSNSWKAKGSGNVVIDDVTYDFKDVMAVQFKKSRFKKNAAGEFAKRYYKSKISIYYTWIDMGGAGRTQNFYYILKGDTGSLVEMTIGNLRAMVIGCPQAIAVLDNYEKLTDKVKRNLSTSVFYECIDIYDKC